MSSSPQYSKDEDIELPMFRASKKRKFHQRQRREASTSPPLAPANTAEGTSGSGAPGDLSTASDVSNQNQASSILNLHSRITVPRRRFGGGIEFSATPTGSTKQTAAATAAAAGTASNEKPSETLSLSSRFAPSTGVIRKQEDEERYMTAYIDSQLKTSSSATATADPKPSSNVETISIVTSNAKAHANPKSAQGTQSTAVSASAPPAKQAALVGKLQEIDLGPSARRRNEKATLRVSQALGSGGGDGMSGLPKAASAPISNAADDDDDEDSDEAMRKKKKLPPKVRVNRYGRILQPRKPRLGPVRSDLDVERDRLVEEMLRLPGAAAAAATDGGENEVGRGAGDERGGEGDEELAERFRREFAENALTAGSRSAAVKAGKKDDAKATGPKMGGSRSARNQAQQAAMRGR